MTLKPCTFANQATSGTWGPAQSFTPSTCDLRSLEADAVRKCLANRTLTFIGDSVLREFGLGLASLLDSYDTQPQKGESKQDRRWRVHAASGRPQNQAVGAALNRTVRKALSGPTPLRNTLGSRGSWRHPYFGVTIRNFNDAPRAAHWHGEHGIERIVQRAGRGELIFVGLGVHDTNTQISERVGAAAAMRWRSSPLSWTHGPVFRPYLDHWCSAAAAAAASPAAARREGRGRGGGLGMPSEDAVATAASCEDDVSTPANSPPLLVWMTTNAQCIPLKPSKWRYQAKIMSAANAASLDAARQYGVPMLDWNGLMRGQGRGESAAAAAVDGMSSSSSSSQDAFADGGMYNASSTLCTHMLDGVHVKHWVDHVRGALPHSNPTLHRAHGHRKPSRASLDALCRPACNHRGRQEFHRHQC